MGVIEKGRNMKKKETTTVGLENIESVHYQWYDHLLVRECPKLLQLVEDSINNHDLNTFLYLKEILNNYKDENGETHVFLPKYVTVYYKENPDESYQFQLTEELFNMITGSDYECG